MDFKILAIFCTFAMSVSAQTCVPTTDCSTANVIGASIPDPSDCTKYYVCISDGNENIIPSASSFKCPTGQYYKATPQFETGCTTQAIFGVCDDNYCGKLKTPADCQTECLNPDPSVVADASDCSVFYVCTASDMIESSCPSDAQYFNGQLCVNDVYQCCSLSAQLYCTGFGQQLSDPIDCSSYFICGAANEVPSLSYKHTCPEGQHYDAASFTCVPGPCN